MLNYKSSMLNSQKYINENLPTASKTNYYDESPSRMMMSTPKGRSPAKYDHRIQEAKSEIGSIINEIELKNNMNRNAYQRVAHENQATANYFKNNMTTIPENKMFNYGDPTTHMVKNPAGIISEYDNYALNQMSLEEENIELRKALNQQLRQNNNMMRYISNLQTQNSNLRAQLGMPLRNFKNSPIHQLQNPEMSNRHTGYFQTIPEADNNMGASEGYHPSTRDRNMEGTHGFHESSNLGHRRVAKAQTRHSQPMKQADYEMFRELQAIKDHDEALRQRTIRMLKGQH